MRVITTIVFKDGILAADGYGTSGGWIVSTLDKKIYRTVDGRLLAGIGGAANSRKLISWLLKPEAKRAELCPDYKECGVVEVYPDGKIRIYEEGHFFPHPHKVLATGSGRSVAWGALEMGADAVTAVKIAIKYDCDSGGRVRWLRLIPTKKRRK